MTQKLTKTDRVIAYLKAGHDLTEAQARARFGVANMSALASNIRFKGYAVYRNTKTTAKGHEIDVYRLGTPSKAVIAAGYRALAQDRRAA